MVRIRGAEEMMMLSGFLTHSSPVGEPKAIVKLKALSGGPEPPGAPGSTSGYTEREVSHMDSSL